MNATIIPAMSLRVANSMPSRPGVELTSSTTGPRPERIRSTPATLSPITLAARTAVRRSSGVISTSTALPPRWRLARKSPCLAVRCIEATTSPPMTKPQGAMLVLQSGVAQLR